MSDPLNRNDVNINAYFIQVRDLERIAEDHEENGMTETAADYREAAHSIRELAERIAVVQVASCAAGFPKVMV